MKHRWYAARKILASALVVVLIVLGGFWVVNGKTANQAPKKPAATTAQSKPVASKTPAPASSGSSGTLTNTGPGDAAGLFAVAFVGGTAAHYLVTRRRLTD